jgi:cation diffusion facilitator CzcD-associated flavoprotein CzcO
MIRACIVGAGPAGIFTADKLLRRFPQIQIDWIEKNQSPYGLLRYGVAPDHPELKVWLNHCVSPSSIVA